MTRLACDAMLACNKVCLQCWQAQFYSRRACFSPPASHPSVGHIPLWVGIFTLTETVNPSTQGVWKEVSSAFQAHHPPLPPPPVSHPYRSGATPAHTSRGTRLTHLRVGCGGRGQELQQSGRSVSTQQAQDRKVKQNFKRRGHIPPG